MRREVWRRLQDSGAAKPPFPVEGRIPNFQGAEEAAARILLLEQWRRAEVVKVNPDSPQRPVRRAALSQGKLLLMPTPRIRRGFLLLDPSRIPARSIGWASTIKGAFRLGMPLASLDKLTSAVDRVDFIVEGSVAVSIHGDRLGKGHGYGDLEWGILSELGLVGEDTPIATTVHDLQVYRDRLPQDKHDVPVDLIATPTRLIQAMDRRPKPRGIYWDELDATKLNEIPILKELAVERNG
ncbi:MAG: 5-formyltetrahydrofolate cyclo-ligase [Desulfurococcales archaeon]|nr:5-formyltetrahydrofolate cyclo-ligase [Desulfurococcales archaeon]